MRWVHSGEAKAARAGRNARPRDWPPCWPPAGGPQKMQRQSWGRRLFPQGEETEEVKVSVPPAWCPRDARTQSPHTRARGIHSCRHPITTVLPHTCGPVCTDPGPAQDQQPTAPSHPHTHRLLCDVGHITAARPRHLQLHGGPGRGQTSQKPKELGLVLRPPGCRRSLRWPVAFLSEAPGASAGPGLCRRALQGCVSPLGMSVGRSLRGSAHWRCWTGAPAS